MNKQTFSELLVIMNLISIFDYCAVAGSTVDGGCEGSFVRS